MSYFTDWYDYPVPEYEYEEDYLDDSIFKYYILGNLYWKRRDGIKVFVHEMTKSHIENILRIPKYRNKENWDIIFDYELKVRNENR